MVIPADLPALVAPVAWMLGTWEGWGMLAGPDASSRGDGDGAAEDSPVVEEIRGEVVGDQMRRDTRLRRCLLDPDRSDLGRGQRALRDLQGRPRE